MMLFSYDSCDTASLQTSVAHLQSWLHIQCPCIAQSHEESGSPESASQPHA